MATRFSGPGQIDAVEEISLQQSLFDPALQAVGPHPCCAGKRDQAVRGDGIGLARNPVERERDAVFGADRGDARIDVLRARGAEFLRHVILPAHALGRQLRIELKRPPAKLGLSAPGFCCAYDASAASIWRLPM